MAEPTKLREADAPMAPHVGSDSSLIQRATSELAAIVAEHARTGRIIPWALVAALTVATGGALGWQYLDSDASECPALVVEHVLHQAASGRTEAERLDALGHHAVAQSVRTLTDVDSQPDNVRLCVLLAQRGAK